MGRPVAAGQGGGPRSVPEFLSGFLSGFSLRVPHPHGKGRGAPAADAEHPEGPWSTLGMDLLLLFPAQGGRKGSVCVPWAPGSPREPGQSLLRLRPARAAAPGRFQEQLPGDAGAPGLWSPGAALGTGEATELSRVSARCGGIAPSSPPLSPRGRSSPSSRSPTGNFAPCRSCFFFFFSQQNPKFPGFASRPCLSCGCLQGNFPCRTAQLREAEKQTQAPGSSNPPARFSSRVSRGSGEAPRSCLWRLLIY